MPCTTINPAPNAMTSRRAKSSAASAYQDASTPTTTRRGSDAGRDADWFIVVTLSGRMGDARIAETTRQCPYCELRFEYHGEIKDHIMRDHPERADVVWGIDPHELPHA